MVKPTALLCAIGLTLALPVLAQVKKVESTTAEASTMERAQRQASNPLRAILEASRFQRKPADRDPPADDAVRRSAAPRSEVALVVTTAAAPASVLPAATREPAAAGTAVLAPMSGSPVATVAALDSIDAMATPTALSVAEGLLAVPPAGPAGADARPRIVKRVEPALPAGLIVTLPRGIEVIAELQLRRDGSVASVTLLPPAPRALQRHVTEALEQWRYEPMAEDRLHRVQLLFDIPP